MREGAGILRAAGHAPCAVRVCQGTQGASYYLLLRAGRISQRVPVRGYEEGRDGKRLGSAFIGWGLSTRGLAEASARSLADLGDCVWLLGAELLYAGIYSLSEEPTPSCTNL